MEIEETNPNFCSSAKQQSQKTTYALPPQKIK